MFNIIAVSLAIFGLGLIYVFYQIEKWIKPKEIGLSEYRFVAAIIIAASVIIFME